MAPLPGVHRQFVQAAMAAPFLEREEERQLAIRWKEHGDQDALDQIAASHMRLVIALASKFRHYGLPIADVIQEGHVGLLEAAARFDPDREVRFSTYATWWIRASIQDYILRNWSIVRGGTSSTQKALFFNLRRLRAQLAMSGDDNRAALFDRIGKAVGASSADVELMNARFSGPDVSLNGPVNGDDPSDSAERGDFLVDTRPLQDETVGEEIDAQRRSALLHDALGHLSERELRIVRERRLHEEGATLEALGAELGISKERVRQIETRALEKLRKLLESRV
ncbi:MAG: RNA polymerase factor sigma-32 [Methylobacteriaceae bacterium]|nr:RNA polymerase factor sigma-32 [Methylobacteriaceae bacterium]